MSGSVLVDTNVLATPTTAPNRRSKNERWKCWTALARAKPA